MTKNLHYIIRMLGTPGIGPRKTLELIKKFSSLENIFAAEYQDLIQIPGVKDKLARAILSEPDEALLEGQLKLIDKYDVKMVTLWDENYPSILREIYDPPIALFCRGNLDLLTTEGLGVVGTRTPTRYGKDMATSFSQSLSGHGLTMVSGAARGVDAMVHDACLKVSGRTVAVLGNGVDRSYPAENKTLLEQISQEGLLVSEFLMGSKPDAPNFPRRNRIISGLTLGTLVIEAAERSGSLITAYFALDQNREVFAIPGPVTSRQSRGTHQLIKQGAKLVESVDDVLAEMEGRFQMGTSQGQQALSIAVDPKENELLEQVSQTKEIHIDELAERLGQTTFALLGTLLQLEMKGLIQQLPGKYFKRRC